MSSISVLLPFGCRIYTNKNTIEIAKTLCFQQNTIGIPGNRKWLPIFSKINVCPRYMIKFGEIKWPIPLFPTADVSLLILKSIFPLGISVRVTCLYLQ